MDARSSLICPATWRLLALARAKECEWNAKEKGGGEGGGPIYAEISARAICSNVPKMKRSPERARSPQNAQFYLFDGQGDDFDALYRHFQV